MGFSRRQKFSLKVDIPATARKEIEYLFLYEIVLIVEQYAIADLLIINFDQTPLKLVQCANSTLVKKKTKKTRTFAITLAGEFLPIQLSYGGKTTQRLPRYQFPEVFSLSVNEKHFSNSKETVKFLNVIIAPYVRKMRKSQGFGKKQMALAIMDVFTGQMTSEVRETFYRKTTFW